MIGYKLEKVSEDSPHYNLSFEKEVHKRDGTIVTESYDKLYGIWFKEAISLIAHRETQDNFGDKDVSLTEYLTQFYKNWNKIINENS